MTAFDPATSYANDYELMDFVEELIWEHPGGKLDGLKGRRADIKGPQYLPVAAGMRLTTSAAAFVVWQPTPTDSTAQNVAFAPQPGQVLTDALGSRWIIQWSDKSRFRHWAMILDVEPQNAA
jgi:hypothetical protein